MLPKTALREATFTLGYFNTYFSLRGITLNTRFAIASTKAIDLSSEKFHYLMLLLPKKCILQHLKKLQKPRLVFISLKISKLRTEFTSFYIPLDWHLWYFSSFDIYRASLSPANVPFIECVMREITWKHFRFTRTKEANASRVVTYTFTFLAACTGPPSLIGHSSPPLERLPLLSSHAVMALFEIMSSLPNAGLSILDFSAGQWRAATTKETFDMKNDEFLTHNFGISGMISHRIVFTLRHAPAADVPGRSKAARLKKASQPLL